MNTREKDDYFDEIFRKHTRGIEDHKFRHYNNALGMWIYSKAHYKHEMKKRGLVPYDEAERLAEKWDKENPHQDYTLSEGAREIIESLMLTADKHGNIQLGSRAINKLIEIGAIKPQSEHTPKGEVKGGFS